MKLLYIAGPYRAKTYYRIKKNIEKAEKVALKYWKRGYAVICPHKNTAFFDRETNDKIWLYGDLEILSRCDGIVMMRGWQKSTGARRELIVAKGLKLNIIYEK